MNTEIKLPTAIPASLEEVWGWKQKAYEEIKNIPAEKQVEFINEKTKPVIKSILEKREKNKGR